MLEWTVKTGRVFPTFKALNSEGRHNTYIVQKPDYRIFMHSNCELLRRAVKRML